MNQAQNRLIWSRLSALKRYREARLRSEISRLKSQLAELDTAAGKVIAQRAQTLEQWRARSGQTYVRKTDGLHALRREFSACYLSDLRLQKESERLQAEHAALQQKLAALNSALHQCIVKQEKLRLIGSVNQRQR